MQDSLGSTLPYQAKQAGRAGQSGTGSGSSTKQPGRRPFGADIYGHKSFKRLLLYAGPCYTVKHGQKTQPFQEIHRQAAAKRPKTTKPMATDLRLETLYGQVREILTAARDQAWQAVNTAMVEAYWEVGRAIVEDEQAGKQRAELRQAGSGRARRASPGGVRQGLRPVQPPQHAGILRDLPDS